MTNYEKIKSMSINEMANMIDNIDDLACAPCNVRNCKAFKADGMCGQASSKVCSEATLNWLESEAENK